MGIKPPAFDPAGIERAPIEPDARPEGGETTLSRRVVELQERLAERNAEIDRLKGQRSAGEIAASMMERSARSVFVFVVVYCVIVALFLLMAGFKHFTRLELSDTILAIIAGSTAVSVIGLMGMVVRGVFGRAMPKASPKRSARKPAE